MTLSRRAHGGGEGHRASRTGLPSAGARGELRGRHVGAIYGARPTPAVPRFAGGGGLIRRHLRRARPEPSIRPGSNARADFHDDAHVGHVDHGPVGGWAADDGGRAHDNRVAVGRADGELGLAAVREFAGWSTGDDEHASHAKAGGPGPCPRWPQAAGPTEPRPVTDNPSPVPRKRGASIGRSCIPSGRENRGPCGQPQSRAPASTVSASRPAGGTFVPATGRGRPCPAKATGRFDNNDRRCSPRGPELSQQCPLRSALCGLFPVSG